MNPAGPPISPDHPPRWFTREAVRAVDRAAIEEFGLPGVVLMENAARALLDRALAMLRAAPGPAVILCGPGNNGGDGYALARHLHNAGVDARVVAVKPAEELDGDAGVNARVAERMGLPIRAASDEPIDADAALIVDALLGTGLTSAPRGVIASLIERANAHPAPVLAVDLPSGLDCDTGEPLGPCVRAAETVTFVGMKAGFANPASREFTGEITVGDIGAPRELVHELGAARPPFTRG